ncbi:MAG: DUF2158 domain-containing protein [Desulfurellaceae bacterium]|nr:DUF2158 domain-containing protein [Desulfurellaceae bacterium]
MEQSQSLKAGDVVRLKSGGPSMTIDRVADGVAVCIRFMSDVRLEERFSLIALERDKSSEEAVSLPPWSLKRLRLKAEG